MIGGIGWAGWRGASEACPQGDVHIVVGVGSDC